MTLKRILIAVPIRGLSFIEQDVKILSTHFQAQCFTFTPSQLVKIITSILAGSCDLVYVWFVNHYAPPIVAACRAVRIPCVLVAGGVDFSNDPEIGYGHMRFGFARAVVKVLLKLCSLVLPVSEFMKQRVLDVASPRALRVICNGVDTEKFTPRGIKENIVLSVGQISDLTVLRKRFDVFVRAAKFLPDYRFILVGEHVGRAVELLKAIAPQNVEFRGRLTDQDLLELYQEARVYVQASYVESFGVALAEAMACECVPVVVRRGALPEVVGDSGYYAPYGDPEGTAQIIMQAAIDGDGALARRRIQQMFTTEKRERELVDVLTEVLKRFK
jgi:glycosyltransferase involved in cell wall biosynthesis